MIMTKDLFVKKDPVKLFGHLPETVRVIWLVFGLFC